MFQGESGFLEELTGGGDNLLQQGNDLGLENNMVAQNVTVGVQQQMGYNQMNSGANQIMQSDNQMQQYSNYDTNYGSQGGMNAMQQGDCASNMPSQVGMMSPNNQYVNPQMNQSGQVQGSQSQQSNYQNYAIQNNACMTPPRPQNVQANTANRSPMSAMWNNSSPQVGMNNSLNMSNIQQQPALQNNPSSTSNTYIAQHDYAVPTSAPTQQRLSHFTGDQNVQSQQNASVQIQQNNTNTFQMHSPQGTQISQINLNNQQMTPQQQPHANVVNTNPQQNLQTVQLQLQTNNFQGQNNNMSLQNSGILVQNAGGNMQQETQNVGIVNQNAHTGQVVQMQQQPQSNIRHIIARGANGQPIRIQQIQSVQGTPNVIRVQHVNVNNQSGQQQVMVQQNQVGNQQQIVLQPNQGAASGQRLTQMPANQSIQLASIGQQQGQTFIISQAPANQNTPGNLSQTNVNQIRIVNMNGGSLANLGVQIRPNAQRQVYANACTVALSQPTLAASNRPQLQIVSQGIVQQIKPNVVQQQAGQANIPQTVTASVVQGNAAQLVKLQNQSQASQLQNTTSIQTIQVRPAHNQMSQVQGATIQVRPPQATQIQLPGQVQVTQMRPQVAQVQLQQPQNQGQQQLQQQPAQPQNIPLKIQQLQQQGNQLRANGPSTAENQQKLMDIQVSV